MVKSSFLYFTKRKIYAIYLKARPVSLAGMIFLIIFVSGNYALAVDYYLDSGRGRDAGSGQSAEKPWKTLDRLKRVSLKPGDVIHLKAGSVWTGQVAGPHFQTSGRKDAPIVLTMYGQGPKPVINAANHLDGEGIKIDGSHIVIDGLMVTGARETGILIRPGADNNTVTGCEITKVGIGVEIGGQNNRVTQNHIHDLHMIVNTPGGDDDYGAVGVWVENSRNEVSYNRIVNCRAPSHDYGQDGGAIEFYSDKQPVTENHVHHNFISGCEGVFESGGPTGLVSDNILSYNICLNNRILFDIHISDAFRSSANIFRLENNTIVEIQDHPETEYYVYGFNGAPHPESVLFKNNIFYIKDYWFLAPADKEGWSLKQENNLYYLANPKSELGFAAGRGDLIQDPVFVDLISGDFHLKEASPAIDAGQDLGYSLDFENKPVPFGRGPDIGAYEYRKK